MPRVSGVDLTHSYNVPGITQHEVDPGVTDDESGAYNVGDEWFNTQTGQFFKCAATTLGAAIWVATVQATLPLAETTPAEGEDEGRREVLKPDEHTGGHQDEHQRGGHHNQRHSSGHAHSDATRPTR